MKHVDLIADGSCLSHRGPGGWACILRYQGFERVLTGGSPVTTNNQMELRAVSMGLRALQEPCDVSVFTDSKYVPEGTSRLVPQWKANRWRNSHGRHLSNRRLWLQLASACNPPRFLPLKRSFSRIEPELAHGDHAATPTLNVNHAKTWASTSSRNNGRSS